MELKYLRLRSQARRIEAEFMERRRGLYAQHDYVVGNDTGASVRSDINSALAAAVTENSGNSAPSTTYALMIWNDTTNSVRKRRNAANSAWLVEDSLSETYVVARSSNTILALSDKGKTFIATSTFTQTLTAAATLGDGWYCDYRNNGTGVITLDPNSSETIDGATTLVLNPGTACRICCNGTSFYTVGRAALNASDSAFGIPLVNGTIVASVAGNALTVAIKTKAAADPSSGDPVYAYFSNVTGGYDIVAITSAMSLVISSGSTLGCASAVAHRLWLVMLNDGGTPRLGIINPASSDLTNHIRLDLGNLVTTTAEGGSGGADSARVFYTTTAVGGGGASFVPIGYLEVTEATAGTWATAPSRVCRWFPGMPLPGDVVQHGDVVTGVGATGATTTPDDNTIPQITEGNQFMTLDHTPKSACNIVEIEVQAMLNPSSTNHTMTLALHQDAIANALKVSGAQLGQDDHDMLQLWHRQRCGTTSLCTYRARAGAGSGNTRFNGLGGAQIYGGAADSHIRYREIFA